MGGKSCISWWSACSRAPIRKINLDIIVLLYLRTWKAETGESLRLIGQPTYTTWWTLGQWETLGLTTGLYTPPTCSSLEPKQSTNVFCELPQSLCDLVHHKICNGILLICPPGSKSDKKTKLDFLVKSSILNVTHVPRGRWREWRPGRAQPAETAFI